MKGLSGRATHQIPGGLFQIKDIIAFINVPGGVQRKLDVKVPDAAFFLHFADSTGFYGFTGFEMAFGEIRHAYAFDGEDGGRLVNHASGGFHVTETGAESCKQSLKVGVTDHGRKGFPAVQQWQNKSPDFGQGRRLEKIRDGREVIPVIGKQKTAIFKKYFIHLYKI